MSYQNPRIPEGINVARESVPVEFLRLAAGLAIVVALLTLALHLAGGWIARQVPFATESAWVGDRIVGLPVAANEIDPQAARTLQALADRLAAAMELPPAMRPRLHLLREDVPNAFATLGGHILVTEGLYRRLPSENALAMVLAHEIAHIRARDPIAAIGSGAALGLLLVALGSDADRLTPQFARLVQLGYSRDAERQADTAAIAALQRLYGHAGGASALFEVLAAHAPAGKAPPPMLSTHPADAERIGRLRAAARGWDPLAQPLLPLPDDGPAPLGAGTVAEP